MRSLLVFAAAGAIIGGAVPLAAATLQADSGGPYRAYLVSDRDAGPAGAEHAAGEIRSLGGRVAVEYREIGVVLAYSDQRDFGARIRSGDGIAAAGASRTATTPVAPRQEADDAAGADDAGDDGVPLVPDPHERPSWNLGMLQRRPAAAGTGSADTAPRTPAPGVLSRVTVAVLDAGVDDTHPDLRSAVDPAASADCGSGAPDSSPGAWRPDPDVIESGHGTHVAGIIGAARNGDGVTGVAPGVRIAAVRLLGPSGQYYGENLVCGFLWAAAHHVRVINDSYFADPWKYNCPSDPDQRAIITAVGRAVAYAQRSGALVVASAGNDAQDLDAGRVDERSPNDRSGNSAAPVRYLGPDCIRLPGQLPGVLDVSAVDRDGRLAAYSNWGAGRIGIAAPGGDPDGGPDQGVVSDWPGGRYASLAGTSMATAHVTGAAAIAAALHPGAGPAELRALLARAAAPVDCAGPEARCAGSAFYGSGALRIPK
ncbi:S8 family peptidase [Phaeacidiphilus oryzae]|uniref:S8 family peptidase n=1 Tax=Phaeacidiphilus oryzae TaxID=348818 RepID=UPI000691C69B|nr:S8 family serine peptidase [Phaeacidiphilus oryzae]